MIDTKAIEEREAKATPGPWTQEAWLEILKSAVQADVNEHDFNKEAFRILADWPTKEVLQDADFIAHARTDIPSLLSAVKEKDAEIALLRKALARAAHVLTEMADGAGVTAEEHDAAVAEALALTAKVKP